MSGTRSRDYERIRVLWPDHLGLARGKYLPSRLATNGTNHCVGVFSQGFDRRVTRVPGAGYDRGFPDIEATFEDEGIRHGWEDGTGVVVADLFEDGRPLAVSARHALRRAVDAWADVGYGVQIGIELEGYVLEPDGAGGWRPWSTPGGFVYGTGPLADPIGLFDEIMRVAEQCDLRIESVNTESDVPQFEITLEYSAALDAVDRTFLLRLMARELAYQRGLLLTFMGRPFADRSGSGMHVNVSLTDRDRGNAFADDSSTDGLSELAHRSLAGLVAHHAGMTALCAPTVNAYKRLRPAMLSGYWANWGYDHRGTANRVPPHRRAGTRIEHRMTDGSANPYLAAAAILHAMRLGVVDSLPLPPPTTGDGLETESTNSHCPDDLACALDTLERDESLVMAMGDDVIANFVAVKRAEWQRFATSVTDWELNEYLWFC